MQGKNLLFIIRNCINIYLRKYEVLFAKSCLNEKATGEFYMKCICISEKSRRFV